MGGVFNTAQNLIKKSGQLFGAPGGPFEPGVYEPRYPAPWAFPQAQEYTKQINSFLPNIDALRSYGPTLMGYGERAADVGEEANLLRRVKDFVAAGSGPNNALWNLTSKRYMDALTPKYSGAGLLTSGPGLNAMSEGMENLATTFGEAERSRQAGELGLLSDVTGQLRGAKESGLASYGSALEGLKALETLPADVRAKLIQILFGQQGMTPELSKSMMEQMGGGQGMGGIVGTLGLLGG